MSDAEEIPEPRWHAALTRALAALDKTESTIRSNRKIRVATVGNNGERMSRGALSRGWVIGTAGWREALAREHQHLALPPEISASEIGEMTSVRWW